MSRPSKKAVMAALAGVFEMPDWEYTEYLGLLSGVFIGSVATESGVRLSVDDPNVYKMRSKLLAFAESIRGAR